jgi:hypothetical protein
VGDVVVIIGDDVGFGVEMCFVNEWEGGFVRFVL